MAIKPRPVKGPYKKQDRRNFHGMEQKFCRNCNDWYCISGSHWYERKSKLYNSSSFYCKIKEKKNAISWFSNNREKVYSAIKNRVDKDPSLKLRSYMGRSLWRYLKGISGKCRYLPFDFHKLRPHLESKFTIGMSWENYGRWHIDHIIPLKAKRSDGSYYWNQKELTNPNSNVFKQAWALDNLQPLWAQENISKGNKWQESHVL